MSAKLPNSTAQSLASTTGESRSAESTICGLPPRFIGIAIIAGLLGIATVFSLVAQVKGWDLALSSRFFVSGGKLGGWVHSHDQPWRFLYTYGEYPPIIAALAAVGLYWASRSGFARKCYAKPCMVLILTVVLGPGLLVNGILKELWGRPRPADITAFGGNSPFCGVWPPGSTGAGKSFCCGHCSVGFAVVAGASFCRFNPVLGVSALMTGMLYGAALGAARIVQGGHFLTDVIWSAALVLVIAAALHFLVLRVPESPEESSEPPS